MATPRVRHIVGCMTGTSLDGLDCALTRIEGEGLEMSAKFVGLHSQPFDETFRAQLRHLAEGNAAKPIDYMRAARQLGVMHAQAVEVLLDAHRDALPPSRLVPEAGPTESATHAHTTRAAPVPPRGRGGSDPQAPAARFPGIDFVVAHGQTIWHAPQDTLSWQLFDPWPIVRHLGLPVCYDLRQADLIAGGQGAPITPIADCIIFGRDTTQRLVLNLGGVCNSTCIQSDGPSELGRDVCLCNLLIDALCAKLFPDVGYDKDGELSASGQAHTDAVRAFRDVADTDNSGSMGREDIVGPRLANLIHQFAHIDAQDLLRSAIEAVAECIGDEMITSGPGDDLVILAGGGARNRTLVEAIRKWEAYFTPVVLSDDLGIPCEAREAMAFAVLGALSRDGVPITLPGVTGAENPGVAGCWVYP